MLDLIPTVEVTPQALAALSGFILSLFFSYFPKLNVKFAKLDSDVQRFIMIGFLFVVSVAIFVLGCFNLITIENFVCEQRTALSFFWIFISAVVSNQSSYSLTPKTKAVREAKKLRDENKQSDPMIPGTW